MMRKERCFVEWLAVSRVMALGQVVEGSDIKLIMALGSVLGHAFPSMAQRLSPEYPT